MVDWLYPPPIYYVMHCFGSEDAAYEMAMSYMTGEGWLQSKDENEGWKVIRKYAARGDRRCARELAYKYEYDGDYLLAAEWYEKAHSWRNAGNAYWNAAKASPSSLKRQYYEKAVEDCMKEYYQSGENVQALVALDLGRIYESWYSVSKDRAMLRAALQWYKEAEAHGAGRLDETIGRVERLLMAW